MTMLNSFFPRRKRHGANRLGHCTWIRASLHAFPLQRSLSTEGQFQTASLKMPAGGGKVQTPSGWPLCPSNCLWVVSYRKINLDGVRTWHSCSADFVFLHEKTGQWMATRNRYPAVSWWRFSTPCEWALLKWEHEELGAVSISPAHLAYQAQACCMDGQTVRKGGYFEWMRL